MVVSFVFALIMHLVLLFAEQTDCLYRLRIALLSAVCPYSTSSLFISADRMRHIQLSSMCKLSTSALGIWLV